MINTLVCALLMLQAPNPPVSIQAGGNMLLQSANLDRSIEFYRDFVGLLDMGAVRCVHAAHCGACGPVSGSRRAIPAQDADGSGIGFASGID